MAGTTAAESAGARTAAAESTVARTAASESAEPGLLRPRALSQDCCGRER